MFLTLSLNIKLSLYSSSFPSKNLTQFTSAFLPHCLSFLHPSFSPLIFYTLLLPLARPLSLLFSCLTFSLPPPPMLLYTLPVIL